MGMKETELEEQLKTLEERLFMEQFNKRESILKYRIDNSNARAICLKNISNFFHYGPNGTKFVFLLLQMSRTDILAANFDINSASDIDTYSAEWATFSIEEKNVLLSLLMKTQSLPDSLYNGSNNDPQQVETSTLRRLYLQILAHIYLDTEKKLLKQMEVVLMEELLLDKIESIYCPSRDINSNKNSLALLYNEFKAITNPRELKLANATESSELRNYLCRAEMLKNCPEVTDLAQKVKEYCSINTCKANRYPFIYIENSSGTGKTQMAFNLMKYSFDAESEITFQAKYLLGINRVEGTQDIYLPFQEISNRFIEALDADHNIFINACRNKQDMDVAFSVDELSRKSLYTFNFINALIGFDYESAFENEAVTKNYTYKPAAPAAPDMRTVIIIDEFPSLSNKDRNYLRLMRNSFRCYKNLIVVLMGTTTAGKNLVVTSSSSSAAPENRWCYYVTRLPRTQLSIILDRLRGKDTLLDNVDEYGWFKEIIMSSRPRFSHYAVTFFEEERSTVDNIIINPNGLPAEDIRYKILEALLAYCFNLTRHSKLNFFVPEAGLPGQYCLFLNYYYQDVHSEKGKEDSQTLYHPSFVNSHFAYSKHKNLELRLDRGVLYHSKVEVNFEFINEICFPPFHEDILMYLSLMGFRPSAENRSHPFGGLTLRKAWKEVVNYLPTIVDPSNRNQITEPGLRLEAWATAALIFSSHCNGLRGIAFGDFLQEVIRQLSDTEDISVDVSIINTELLNTKIPYFAPPDMTLPQFGNETLQEIFGKFGFITRPKNNQEIDVIASSTVVGNQVVSLCCECKDRNTFSGPDLRSVFGKIPKEAKIAFVIGRTIQGGFDINDLTKCIPDFNIFRLTTTARTTTASAAKTFKFQPLVAPNYKHDESRRKIVILFSYTCLGMKDVPEPPQNEPSVQQDVLSEQTSKLKFTQKKGNRKRKKTNRNKKSNDYKV